MNADTRLKVNQIKAQGYYQKGTTMGEGGWGAVYSFSQNWLQYQLIDLDTTNNKVICTIWAQDDDMAIKAFADLFSLGEFAHEVYKVEIKHTLILEQL